MERSRLALSALIALSAVGCFSDRGIAIEVEVGTTGATSVELYVGNSACADHKDAAIRCDGGIAPPTVGAHLVGTVWFRDDEVPYRAPVVDHKATFRLQADADTKLPIVIAVGSGGDPASPVGTATLIDVNVPAKTARILTTKLIAAGAVQPSPSTASEDRVQVWPQPAGSSCVVVEHWADGKATRDFIVPARDPDCDSEGLECDPAAANGAIQMDGIDRKADCYAAGTDAADEPCKLGALGCVDGSAPSGMCFTTREEVCVPKALCDCRGPTANDACAADKLGDALSLTVPHIRCFIPIPRTDANCKVHNSQRIGLNRHLSATRCEQPLLSSYELAKLDDRDRSHNFNGIDLELAPIDNQCGFTVQVNSGSHATGTQEIGMVRLEADQHVVLLPINLVFVDAPPLCPKEGLKVDCSFLETPEPVPEDPMWSCVP